MPVGILITGTAMGAVGLSQNYWHIFFAVMLSGIGGAIFHPEAARMINFLSGKNKGTGLSIFSVGGNGGFCIGPLLMVGLISLWGLKGIMFFAVLGVLMAAVLALAMPKAMVKQTAVAAAGAGEPARQEGTNDWRGFSRLTLVILCRSMVFSGLNSFIPLFWVSVLGQSKAAGGTALTVLFAVGAVMSMLGGVAADRLGYIRVLRFSLLAWVPLVAALAADRSVLWAWVLLLPLGWAMFAPYSATVVLGQQYLGRSIGFASGVTMGLSFSVGGMVVPLLGGLADASGLVTVMWVLTAAAAVGAAASFFLPEPHRERQKIS